MLGEEAPALSATPAAFESRLGRRLISTQGLDVFVIVVRPLLPGVLVKPPTRETLLQEKPFAAGFKLPSCRLPFAAGSRAALGAGQNPWGRLVAGTRVGGQRQGAATGSSSARSGGGLGGSVCPPGGVPCAVLVPTGQGEGMPMSSQGGDDAGGSSPREKGRACSGWWGETEARRCSEPRKALRDEPSHPALRSPCTHASMKPEPGGAAPELASPPHPLMLSTVFSLD